MRGRGPGIVEAAVVVATLSGMVLIPALRPLLARLHPGRPGAVNAFLTLHLLGAALGAPVLGRWWDRRGGAGAARLVATLLAFDGVALLLCTSALPLPVLLGLRFLQGAANLGAVTVLFGLAGRGQDYQRALGRAGAAVVVAIACATPLGALLLRLGDAAPLQVMGLVLLACALMCARWLPSSPTPRRAAPTEVSGSVAAPALWIAVERFTVGCFVVSFMLWAHGVRGLSDGQASGLLAIFLCTFAVAAAALGRRLERPVASGAIILGLIVYGGVFVALPATPTRWLAPLFLLAGLASAAIYTPSLCLAAGQAPAQQSATVMGVLHSAGAVGMLIGSAVGGLLAASLRAAGLEEAALHGWVFRVAGLAPLLVLAATAPRLRPQGRGLSARLEGRS